jgi:hypothetical protein
LPPAAVADPDAAHAARDSACDVGCRAVSDHPRVVEDAAAEICRRAEDLRLGLARADDLRDRAAVHSLAETGGVDLRFLRR